MDLWTLTKTWGAFWKSFAWGSLGLVLLCGIPCSGASQFRGPDRDGRYPDQGLLDSWPEDGPELLWSASGLGKGYGSVSFLGDHWYSTGQEEKQDVLYCLQDGKLLWRIPYGPSWTGSYPESRCTPTVFGDRLYVTSGSGVVACLQTQKPERIWKVDAFAEFGGSCGIWGVAENPLVTDECVYFTPGGEETTMIALNRHTGELVWKSESLHDSIAYVSPIMVEYGGRQTVVNVTGKFIFGVDAQTGDMLWNYKYYDLDRPDFHPDAPIINAVSPIYHDGRLFVTSGYNHVGALFQLSLQSDAVELVWKSPTLDCHHGGIVRVEGAIYGANWGSNAMGAWCCLDWETGVTRWETSWHNKGSIIYADGHLICYEEKQGHVGLVKPSPSGFELVSSFRIQQGKGPHWAHPSIHDGILAIRHGDSVMAFDLRDR